MNQEIKWKRKQHVMSMKEKRHEWGPRPRKGQQKERKNSSPIKQRERPPSSRRKTHGATQLRNLNTKIQNIKDEKKEN